MVYSFEDNETGDEFELEMSYEELLQFLKDNPGVSQTFQMNLGDSIRMGVTKPPSDFSKYVLGRVKEVAGANKDTIEKRYTIPKEI